MNEKKIKILGPQMLRRIAKNLRLEYLDAKKWDKSEKKRWMAVAFYVSHVISCDLKLSVPPKFAWKPKKK